MKARWLKYAGYAAAGIIAIKLIMNQVWDNISAARIRELHPAMKPLAVKLLQEARKQGINLRITSGLRTETEQQALYDQGRTRPGKIVTNAKPWQSYHNYGLAIDVVPMNAANQPVWNSKDWNKIGQIGKSIGLRWGGDFKNLVDKPHFETGPRISDLNSARVAGNVDANGFVKFA